MPELPEAERARQTLEQVLDRRIVDVDDTDTYVCRPHAPGEIADALTGHTLTSAHRRGKFLWLETEDGPTLGLHLGMAGRIALDPPEPESASARWDRFIVHFEDGSRFALRDKRRLGRAVLNPDHSRVGPDAALITAADFRDRIGAGHTAVKARLLDQHAVSGVGNLLADQALWQAGINPATPTGSLEADDLNHLRTELRKAIRQAVAKGGVHTGAFIPARKEGVCPRCGTALGRGKVGGRTTYWCPVCQAR